MNIFLLFILAVSLFGTWVQSDEGGCKEDKYSTGTMTVGEKRNIPGKCREATCQTDLTVSYEACWPYRIPQDCGLREDFSKPFPECCIQVCSGPFFGIKPTPTPPRPRV